MSTACTSERHKWIKHSANVPFLCLGLEYAETLNNVAMFHENPNAMTNRFQSFTFFSEVYRELDTPDKCWQAITYAMGHQLDGEHLATFIALVAQEEDEIRALLKGLTERKFEDICKVLGVTSQDAKINLAKVW